jgi:hypothetical protein
MVKCCDVGHKSSVVKIDLSLFAIALLILLQYSIRTK